MNKLINLLNVFQTRNPKQHHAQEVKLAIEDGDLRLALQKANIWMESSSYPPKEEKVVRQAIQRSLSSYLSDEQHPNEVTAGAVLHVGLVCPAYEM